MALGAMPTVTGPSGGLPELVHTGTRTAAQMRPGTEALRPVRPLGPPLTPDHQMRGSGLFEGFVGGVGGFLSGGWPGAAVGLIGGLGSGGETTADKIAKQQQANAAQQNADAAALLKTYGYPGMDALMVSLGFTKDANGKWVGGPTGPYDEKTLTSQMVGTRDQLEPEMQRQIDLANEQLAQKGMGRSSLSGGVQVSMRGDFVKALAQKRLQMIQQLTAERWSRIMNLIAASEGQAGAATQGANASLNASIAASNQADKQSQQTADYWGQLGQWLADQANDTGGGGSGSDNPYLFGDPNLPDSPEYNPDYVE